jgi:hypothetical protein
VRTRRRTGKNTWTWRRRRRISFPFLPGSQCVLTMYPWSSPSSQCAPQVVLHSTSLLSHMLLANVVLLSHVYYEPP